MSNQKQKIKMNMYVHAEKNQPKKFLSIWKKKIFTNLGLICKLYNNINFKIDISP